MKPNKHRSKKIKKIAIKEPRPVGPNLILNLLELTDKVNEIIDRLNEQTK